MPKGFLLVVSGPSGCGKVLFAISYCKETKTLYFLCQQLQEDLEMGKKKE